MGAHGSTVSDSLLAVMRLDRAQYDALQARTADAQCAAHEHFIAQGKVMKGCMTDKCTLVERARSSKSACCPARRSHASPVMMSAPRRCATCCMAWRDVTERWACHANLYVKEVGWERDQLNCVIYFSYVTNLYCIIWQIWQSINAAK